MLWKRLAFSLSIVLILVAIPLLTIAQNGENVAVGDALTGQLTLENPSATYTILAAEGDRLILTLRSSDFDSYLTLLDQDGGIVAEDDDGAGGKDALIEAVLPSTGLYTIQASSYNQASTGSFFLTIAGTVSEIPTPTPVPTRAPVEQVSITYGASVDGTLTASDEAAEYSFEGQQGDQVTITLTSIDFDAYVTLVDAPQSRELISDDDSAGNLNARIEDYALPATGTYLIRAGSYGGGAEGSYTLTLESTTGQTQVTPTPQPDVTATEAFDQNSGSLVYGRSVDGALTDGATPVTHSFEGQAGDRVTILLTSPDFDAYLRLLLNDSVLAEDDDSAGDLNARIQNFELPSSGTYTIEVSSVGGNSGEYVLALEGDSTVQATQPPTDATPPAATGSQTVEGLLSHDLLSATYPFEGRAGDTVTITMTSAEFDSYLLLQDARGETLSEDDDSAGNLNAQIVYTLPADGTYTLVATSNTRNRTGAYSLTAEGIETELILNAPHLGLPEAPFNDPSNHEIGSTIFSEFNRDAGGNGFTFTAEAGQVITINVSSDDFDTFVTLYQATQDGTYVELINDDDSAGNLNSRIENFTLPESGVYLIAVTDVDGTGSGTFTLTTERGVATVVVTPVPTEAASSGGNIEIGAILDGVLPATNAATYTFEGQEGQSVTITVMSSEFDPFVTLTQSDGQTLTSDDDSAGSLNARIEAFTLPETGRYNIVVSRVAGSGTGSFTLELSGGVEPSDTVTITPGSVEGALTSDQPAAIYFFEGQAGESVTIVATSAEFDVFLTLSGSDGNVLVSDDDSAGNLNARIENFVLPIDDSYMITVSSFAEGVSGSFTLILETSESGGQPTPTPTSDGDTISLGQTINGSLDAGQQWATYTFEGESGQTLSITARSEEFDTYLRVSDSSGVELAYDDDSGGNLDSRINLFRVPSNDTYTITVESYDGAYGDFTLELGESTVRNIEYTQTIDETLESGEVATYRFGGNAGENVVINLNGDFDTYLSLADSNGVTLIENDDAGSSNNSLIGPYALPADGTYFIYVRSYDNTTGGRYTLRMDRAELIRLSYGEDLNAIFEAEGGPMYFEFEGSFGDVVTIRADSNTGLDTALVLIDPNGYQLIADEDGGAGYDPEILNFALDQDGLYIIVLRTAVPGDTGQVNLTLSKADARSLDDRPQEVTLSDQHSQDFVSFTGRAGERVLLTVESLTPPTLYSPYISVQQGDQTLYYSYGANLSRQMIELTIPADGEVIVGLEFYDTTEARLRLSVETLDR